MSIDNTLDIIDELIARVGSNSQCPQCQRWHALRPNSSGVARWTCCGTTYDVNLSPPGR